MPMTWQEELALKIEACLADMELANKHLAAILNEIQYTVFKEDKAISKDKALARIRAKIPEPQTRLGQRRKGRQHQDEEAKGSVQHLGEAKDAERLIEEDERDG